MSSFNRNECPPSAGITVQFAPEYASQEVTPDRLIKRKINAKNINFFLSDLIKRDNFVDIKAPELEEEVEKLNAPLHEMRWRPFIKIPSNDPFGFLRVMATIAIENRDLNTFEKIIDTAIESFEIADRFFLKELDKDNLISTEVRNYPLNEMVNIGLHTCGVKECEVFTERFLNKVGIYVLKKQVLSQHQIDSMLIILAGTFHIGQQILKKDNQSSAIIPVIILRQFATKNLRKISIPIENVDDIYINHGLTNCVSFIKKLGEKAIENGKTEFLYRCLDALGWLGCAAARNDERNVGNSCANAIVQLGRISRAKKVECFWERCALAPCDHAFERLEWILSWTVNLPELSRKSNWERTLSEAFSRLVGKVISVRYLMDDGKIKAQIECIK